MKQNLVEQNKLSNERSNFIVKVVKTLNVKEYTLAFVGNVASVLSAQDENKEKKYLHLSNDYLMYFTRGNSRFSFLKDFARNFPTN